MYIYIYIEREREREREMCVYTSGLPSIDVDGILTARVVALIARLKLQEACLALGHQTPRCIEVVLHLQMLRLALCQPKDNGPADPKRFASGCIDSSAKNYDSKVCVCCLLYTSDAADE